MLALLPRRFWDDMEPESSSPGERPFVLFSSPNLKTPEDSVTASEDSVTASEDTVTASCDSEESEAPLRWRDPVEPEEVPESSPNSLRTMVEWTAVIVSALAIALLIRQFAFQAFEIPSGSMQTTLNINDRILVNKLSYKFGDPQRGHLMVFSKLEGTNSDTDELIKRVIALPGEVLEVRDDGRLWIWGPGETEADAWQLEESYLEIRHGLLEGPRANDSPDQNIWHPNCINLEGDGSRCILNDSSYFMMGDNRTASTDSRSFGPVPDDHVVGRAMLRIWPLDALGGL